MTKKQNENQNSISNSSFMAYISHELRTPLNSIFGMTELMLKTDLTNKQFEYLNIITRSSENMLAIINDILDISKIESGELKLDNIEFNLKDVINTSLNTIYYAANNKGIILSCDYTQFGKDIILFGDPARLNQIILNILDNALKYTDNGSIDIKVDIIKETDSQVDLRFSVNDTGRGIEEKELENILNTFSHSYTDFSNSFSGLGLVIANRIATLMSGRIQATSKLGQGSQFSINIPFKKGISKEIIKEEKEVENEVKEFDSNIKVLLAEDQAFNQIVVVNILQDFGFVVDVVDNGKKAINLLKEKVYDVILMDIQMPVMDGIEATKYIRNSFPGKVSQIPIIAITANAYSPDHKEYIDAGMNDTISKPFRSNQLFQKITNVLKIKNVPELAEEVDINTFYTVSSKNEESNQKAYDLSLLENISKGKPDMMIKMLETFIDRTDEEIKLLKEYCKVKDWDNCRKIIHKMKPSISYLGMKEIENKINFVQRVVKEEQEYDNLDLEVESIENLLYSSFVFIREEIKTIKENAKD